jgi:uncharacterized membrane protein (UPF0127 family)
LFQLDVQMRMTKLILVVALSIFAGIYTVNCSPQEDAPSVASPAAFARMGTVDVVIRGQKFQLWIADEEDERENGLMNVTAEQLAALPDGTERGMIFVFPDSRIRSFWMKDTIVPLDIAYIDPEGTVVNTYTMAPLDERIWQYPSDLPAQYAIEVNGGVWARLGVSSGEHVELPDSVLKHSP